MTTPPPTRVLVVEDSLTVRRHICDVLGATGDFEVVGEAEDGKRAIELCHRLRPDVITMDMMLPVMSGLAATEYIMAHCPTPILIVSSASNRGAMFRTYEALAAGALEVLEKPSGAEPDGAWEEELRRAVQLVSRIRVITHLRARIRARATARPPRSQSMPSERERRPIDVMAIGASTGGPGAVSEVLSSLPPTASAPILLVVHMGESFGNALIEWLDGQSSRRVSRAVEGESVARAAGRVIMAPPGVHMTVVNGTIRLTRDLERHSCRPSIDVLFESIARSYGPAVAACILTGMGRDGASGLLEIRQRGGLTIAQDEATSVVYGMPREAALLGAAEHVLPLSEIGPTLGSLTHPRKKETP